MNSKRMIITLFCALSLATLLLGSPHPVTAGDETPTPTNTLTAPQALTATYQDAYSASLAAGPDVRICTVGTLCGLGLLIVIILIFVSLRGKKA
jgi:hypothetical protein